MTTPDGLIVSVIVNKIESPKRCRLYREKLIGHLAARYGEAKRFVHDPGYGDRYVIVQGRNLISVICDDSTRRLTIEYTVSRFKQHGFEELVGELDTKGF